jgi:hypothetical protein
MKLVEIVFPWYVMMGCVCVLQGFPFGNGVNENFPTVQKYVFNSSN